MELNVKVECSTVAPALVNCPICTWGFKSFFLKRHISVVHFKILPFKCACGQRFADLEEVDKHRDTYGHLEEPTDTSAASAYLMSVIDLMASQSAYCSLAGDQQVTMASLIRFNKSTRWSVTRADVQTATEPSIDHEVVRETDADVDESQVNEEDQSNGTDEDRPNEQPGGRQEELIRTTSGLVNKFTHVWLQQKSSSRRDLVICGLCQSKAIDVSDLNALSLHTWGHMSAMPFTCSQCDFGSPEFGQVETHIKEEHGKEGHVKLPSLFDWSTFDWKFYSCFSSIFPPVERWPENYFLLRYAHQMKTTLEITYADFCSDCRGRVRPSQSRGRANHTTKVNHIVRYHVEFKFRCSHGCNRNCYSEAHAAYHIRNDHGGNGSVIGPTVEQQKEIQRQFEICFQPASYRPPLLKVVKTESNSSKEVCQDCQGPLERSTLKFDGRVDHIFKAHMDQLPFACSGCSFRSVSHRGVRCHNGKATGNQHKSVVNPTVGYIEEFSRMFRHCFKTEPPAKILAILKNVNGSETPSPSPSTLESGDDTVSVTGESRQLEQDPYEQLWDKLTRLSRPCFVVLSEEDRVSATVLLGRDDLMSPLVNDKPDRLGKRLLSDESSESRCSSVLSMGPPVGGLPSVQLERLCSPAVSKRPRLSTGQGKFTSTPTSIVEESEVNSQPSTSSRATFLRTFSFPTASSDKSSLVPPTDSSVAMNKNIVEVVSDSVIHEMESLFDDEALLSIFEPSKISFL